MVCFQEISHVQLYSFNDTASNDICLLYVSVSLYLSIFLCLYLPISFLQFSVLISILFLWIYDSISLVSLYPSLSVYLHFSQKKLLCKIKSRLVTIVCAGYVFWQLFLWRLYITSLILFVSVSILTYFVQPVSLSLMVHCLLFLLHLRKDVVYILTELFSCCKWTAHIYITIARVT